METLILVFTGNCLDDFTLRSQLKSLVNSYGGEENVRVIEKPTEIDYDEVENEINRAKLKKISNFLVLEDPKNFVKLDNALNEEYGEDFQEIKAVPEQFRKLKESNVQNSRPINQINLLCFDASFPTKSNLELWKNIFLMYQQPGNVNKILPAAVIDGEQFIGGLALSDILPRWPFYETYKSYGLENLNGNRSFIDYKDTKILLTFLEAIIIDFIKSGKQLNNPLTLNIVGSNARRLSRQVSNQFSFTYNSHNIQINLTFDLNTDIRPCYDPSTNKAIYSKLNEVIKEINDKKTKFEIKDSNRQAFKEDEATLSYLMVLIKAIEVLKDQNLHLSPNQEYKNRNELQKMIDEELNRIKTIFKDSSLETVAGVIQFIRTKSDKKKYNNLDKNSSNNDTIRKSAIIFNSPHYKELCKLLELNTKKK